MKKQIITLAVAAACAAPLVASANPILYGRVNVNLVNEDMDSKLCQAGTTRCVSDSSEAWDTQNNASRIGVKGSEDLGNGLAAVYQFEFGVDASDSGGLSGRLAYAGLTGGFGTFAMGRQWTPYYGSVDKTDIMQIGGMNDIYLGLTRVGNAVAYVTPNFNGLSGKLALVIDNGGAEDVGEDFADWWNASVDYDNGPLSVGLSYLAAQGDVDGALWGLAGKYNFGMFSIIGQYEDADEEYAGAVTTSSYGDWYAPGAVVPADDAKAWAIGAEVYLGNNTIRAVYGDLDAGDAGEATSWSLGVEHNFSKRTRIFAEYQDLEAEKNYFTTGNVKENADEQRFGVGIRHDF
ncbi:porin [Thioalbus denitrificans]|uniref:Putative porin n=1 Tax=Thioalbus denitrificans TaxID=547122 RepID=A0A369CJY7_9GAMM|nr:porin [Thioalbus denitrificans]RCX33395.1 putative porin [Thioalbus denitrificans]